MEADSLRLPAAPSLCEKPLILRWNRWPKYSAREREHSLATDRLTWRCWTLHFGGLICIRKTLPSDRLSGCMDSPAEQVFGTVIVSRQEANFPSAWGHSRCPSSVFTTYATVPCLSCLSSFISVSRVSEELIHVFCTSFVRSSHLHLASFIDAVSRSLETG